MTTCTDNSQDADGSSLPVFASAHVLLSVRVNNLFTREQLNARGIDEHDMVLECFENLYDLVANGEDITVEDVDVRWTNSSK